MFGQIRKKPWTDRLRKIFFLESLEGEWVRLSDYRGKPVLLNFWASWCPPCKEEMPAIIEFASSHPDIEVLTANLTFTELSLDALRSLLKSSSCYCPCFLTIPVRWPESMELPLIRLR